MPRKKRLVGSELSLRIRQFRQEQGLTLDALAAKTGLTRGFLSKVERGLGIPSIASLIWIAQALNRPMGAFFSDHEDEPVSFVRRDERKPFSRQGSAFGYNYFSIAYKRKRKWMEPYVMSPPRVIDGDRFFTHDGEEMIFVIKGTMESVVHGRRYLLRKGDCIYYDASLPHRNRSLGRIQAEALVVTCLPRGF